MKIVLTVMVRDEVDVIAAMIEHHLAQGVDLIIATDNGSVDGTTQMLEAYAESGAVELHHDPVHRKQQGVVVTGMARRARTEHAADWVINADADEFWVPADKSLTLRTALEHIPLALNAFTVPVTNLVGPPAILGAGFDRLLWRDTRSVEQLQAIGIHAQPTDDAVHRGEADIVVAQGNHFVSLQSNGQPDEAFALEVLHLPWRSWTQVERKVINAGLAYAANPELRPSKNHHGMADYRRYQGDRLFPVYMLRHPTPDELEAGEHGGWFTRDTWLRDQLHGLIDNAVRPDLLKATLDTSLDELLDPERHYEAVELGHKFMTVELERAEALRLADERLRTAQRLADERDKARRQRDRLRRQRDRARAELRRSTAATTTLPKQAKGHRKGSRKGPVKAPAKRDAAWARRQVKRVYRGVRRRVGRVLRSLS